MRRRAFTLTELLVVMVVVVFLAALTVAYVPRLFDNDRVLRGADALATALVQARQYAMLLNRPTGLRLVMEGDKCVGFEKIQTPDDPARGHYVGSWDETTDSGPVAFFQLPKFFPAFAEERFTSPSFGIEPGDRLFLYHKVWVIHEVRDTSLVLRKGSLPLPGPALPADGDPRRDTKPYVVPGKYVPDPNDPDPTNPTLPLVLVHNDPNTANYNLVLRPRTLPGEPPTRLPEGVGIDLGMSKGLAAAREVMFSPNGELMTGRTANETVILWVRNVEKPTKDATPILVAVASRTGFVSTHPAATTGDPYEFAKDGKSSGM